MAKEEFNERITTLQGKITNYEQMKARVRNSFLVRLSGLREPLLFFFQCYEEWQESRNKMFRELASDYEPRLAQREKLIFSLTQHRDALEASNLKYIEVAKQAEAKLAALMREDKPGAVENDVHDGGVV